MDSIESKIIAGAFSQFLQYGLRAVTMDDVARELAISKKTLYRHVSNKADLVHKCVQSIFFDIKTTLENISESETNAIEELFAIDAAISNTMKAQEPMIVNQLRRYFTESFKWLESHREELFLRLTERNLKKGVNEGLYRNDMNLKYIALLYYAQSLLYAQENLVPNELCHNPAFLRENLIYHIRGIASTKGLQYLTDKLKNEK